MVAPGSGGGATPRRFGVLIQAHDRVIRKRETATRAVQWYERGLARLENRSRAGDGESGDRFLDEDHPYARDLDLFGSGSLFQLVNTCQTTTGEETLARWLLGAAEPGTVHARQAAVGDMSDRVQLREEKTPRGLRSRRQADGQRHRRAANDVGWQDHRFWELPLQVRQRS